MAKEFLGNIKGNKGDKGDKGDPGKDAVQTVASVLEYGAVGDGVADDTISFTNALLENETVHVPDGYTFKIENVELNNNKLVGNGVLKWVHSPDNNMLILKGSSELSGITFDGDSGNHGSERKNAILIKEPKNVSVTNNKFTNFNGVLFDMVDLETVPQSIIFYGNNFYDTNFLPSANVINVKHSNTTIENNTFNNIGNGHCIRMGYFGSDSFEGLSVENTIIKSNRFSNTLHNAITLEINTVNTTVSNNFFDSCPQAIKCEPTTEGVVGLTVSGNSISNISLSTALNLVCDNVIFTNNTCENMGGGVFFGDNFLCDGNTFNNCGAETGGYSISDTNTNNSGVVSNNLINNPTHRGIVLQGSTTAVNNTVKNCHSECFRLSGKNFIIKNNRVQDSETGFWLVSISRDFVLTENVIVGCVNTIVNTVPEVDLGQSLVKDNIIIQY